VWDANFAAQMKDFVCKALAARAWFRTHGPPWAPPLPLSTAEREALECGGRLHLVSRYALSLLMLDWDYKLHPSFDDFCRGLMAYKHTPDYLRDDPELQREFPPKPLAGLSDLRWRTAEQIRDYELMEVRARERGLIWANGRTVLASVFLRPRG
jgi:hypothetical protein